ncbi:MAG: DUF3307 domain-containing protein [Bacillota bacterium]
MGKMVLIIFLLAHFLADFVFQSNEVATKKKEKITYLVKHIFIVFFVYFIFILPIFSLRFLIIITAIALLHFLIDLLKITLEQREKIAEIHAFFIDQLLHIVILFLLYPAYWPISFQEWIIRMFYQFSNFYELTFSFNYFDILRFIIIISGYIFVWKPGSQIVEKTLKNYRITKPEPVKEILINTEKETANPGELIGKLERVLLLSFIISNNFLAISIIFTAKSVARFSNFKDKDFANYYIIGTLISLLIAMGVGFVVKLFLG